MPNAAWNLVRKKPYTNAGVRRLPCIRCKVNKANYQWQICSDGNNYRPICDLCDIALNELVLAFFHHPEARRLMAEYSEKVRPSKGLS